MNSSFFTLYEIATLNNLVPKLFNIQHSISFDVKTADQTFHISVEGEFNPKTIEVTDVIATVKSPAGSLVGHGLSILDAFNDIIRQLPPKP